MVSAATTALGLDPAMVLPFIDSVHSVLRTMLQLEATIGAPGIKSQPGPEYDCTGIIAFSGNIVGTVVISFETDAAVKMVEAFAGCALTPDCADFADAIGELTNMIAGGAKKGLGHLASISVPTIILGKGHIVSRPSDVPCLVIPVSTKLGNFAVEISIKTV